MSAVDRTSVPGEAIRVISDTFGIVPPDEGGQEGATIIMEEISALVGEVDALEVKEPPTMCDIRKMRSLSVQKKRCELEAFYTRKELGAIARLVNPAEKKWKAIDLIVAFRHLIVFEKACEEWLRSREWIVRESPSEEEMEKERDTLHYKDDEVEECISRFTAARSEMQAIFAKGATSGLKSMTCPLSFDAAMLFTACRSMGIPTSYDTTSSDMRHAISIVLMRAYLPAIRISESRLSEHNYGRPITSDCECSIVEDSENFRRIQTNWAIRDIMAVATSLSASQRNVLSIVHPSSCGEAIVLTAILFNLDISMSVCPISEFYKAVSDAGRCRNGLGPGLANFCPLGPEDSLFVKTFRQFPTFFDLRENWSEKFSRLYTVPQLEFFAEVEGFTIERPRVGGGETVIIGDESPASSTSICESASIRIAFPTADSALNHTIHNGTVMVGWHPEASNSTSPYSLEDLDDVFEEYGPDGILSIRIAGHSDLIIACSIQDFIEAIATTKAFVITFNHDDVPLTHYLSRRVVKKLKRLCDERRSVAGRRGATLPLKTLHAYRELYEAIEGAEKQSKSLTEHAKILKTAFSEANVAESVKNAFEKLLRAGMFMRGWKVANPESDAYPLKSSDTTYDCAEHQWKVEMNSTEALDEFETAVAAIPDHVTRELVEKTRLLRAVKCGGSSIQFVGSLNSDQGVTILDRIKIVKEGETTQNVFSCMRMSSNMFVGSAVYYLSVLGFDPGVDMSDVDEIF
jgi:hypothetical protein